MAEKIFYSMGEVAEMFDVKTSLIRHWETQFSVLKPKRNKKGNRLFSPEDVENLKVIYHLVKERGMTLEGAKRAMKRRAANGDEIRREAELMTRLKHIRTLLLEVREDLKTGAEGIVDEDKEPTEADAMRAFDATEEGPIEEAGSFETEEAGDFEEPGCFAEAEESNREWADADVQAEEEEAVVMEEPHAEKPEHLTEAEDFAEPEDFTEEPHSEEEAEERFAEAAERMEEPEATEWAEEEPLAGESERELQVVEVLDDTGWEETAHYAEPESNRETEVHFAEPAGESDWEEIPAAVEPAGENNWPEEEPAMTDIPAATEPAAEESDWGKAPAKEMPSAEPGEPKSRTAGRRGRRKSDDDDKELFAFYEQSLF